MPRSICALLLAVAIAGAANAASLSINPDKLTYNVGETITLSINGDAQGATTDAIFGRLQYNGALVDNDTRSQKLIGPGWTQGSLEAYDTNAAGPTTANSEAFDQVNYNSGSQTATSPIATVTLIATSAGILDLIWDTTNVGMELIYFGLTSAPGASVTIVPEPATGALLGAGLLALAGARRRRGGTS